MDASIESMPGAFLLRRAITASVISSSVSGGEFGVVTGLFADALTFCCSGVSVAGSSGMTRASSNMLMDSDQLLACCVVVLTAVAACVGLSLSEQIL